MISSAVRKIKPSLRLFSSLQRLLLFQSVVQESKEALIPFQFYDIAANLSDQRYEGKYYGKQVHQPDFAAVVKRAQLYGVNKMLFAAGFIEDALTSYNLALKGPHFYSTIGVHPCRAKACKEDVEGYFTQIRKTIEGFENKSKLVAIGECGLDYDRFDYASKEDQLKAFPPHFELAQEYKLPMYLHSRSTGGDFVKIVSENRSKFSGGVVHSFTGDLEELKQIIDLGLYVGVNGCSLKTEANLEVVKQIPLDRLMLQTDCPYCDIRNSHASKKYVKTNFQKVKKEKHKGDKVLKDRNEPCTIIQVLEVVAAIKEVEPELVAQKAWDNSLELFHP